MPKCWEMSKTAQSYFFYIRPKFEWPITLKKNIYIIKHNQVVQTKHRKRNKTHGRNVLCESRRAVGRSQTANDRWT